jgi:hypothetical protein
MQPSIPILLGFLSRYGLPAIPKLAELLNSGRTLTEISPRMEMDISQLSRAVRSMFLKTYVLHPSLQEVLDHPIESQHAEYEEMKATNARVLKSVQTH